MTIIIPLTQGQFTIVDDEDADLLQLKWQAQFAPSYANGGAFRAKHDAIINGKRTTELMHRVILSRKVGRPLLRSELVDHENRDPLCNLRANLRLANYSQNNTNRNRSVQRNSSSGIRGVWWIKSRNKWRAVIYANGKQSHIGYFEDLTEAAIAFSKVEAELHREAA